MLKILVVGGDGMLGSRFVQLAKKEFELTVTDKDQLDITNISDLESYVNRFQPNIIVNFAAFTNVGEAELQKNDTFGLCYQLNVEAVKNIAVVCKNNQIRLVHLSTEYIFDGKKSNSPYTEKDNPNPTNWYGETKLLAESKIQDSGCGFLIARLSMPYVAKYSGKEDIVRKFIKMLQDHRKIKGISDSKITPIFGDDLIQALILLINQKSTGVYHICSLNLTTPFEFITEIVDVFGFDKNLISEVTFGEYVSDRTSPVLQYSWLDSTKFIQHFGVHILHTTKDSLELLKTQINLQ